MEGGIGGITADARLMRSSQQHQTDKEINRIVILGGGTAGWLTAGILAASLKKQNLIHPVTVTLVESSAIPIAGVGEGTWPSMRRTLKLMGVKETDFINQCGASFKQGAKFCGWVNGKSDDSYYHPLVLPNYYNEVNLAHAYSVIKPNQPFSDITCHQGELCELALAPKNVSQNEYQGMLNYAYHLDATQFASFIAKHCINELNVEHIIADVTKVDGHIDEHIQALITEQGQRIEGDLFVDCSGFRAALIGNHYQVPFTSCKDILFCDRAVAAHLPYAEGADILPYTLSTATPAGWIWDINLPKRRGTGHVYSSEYTSDDEALAELQRYAGIEINQQDARVIPITPGYREKFWHKNCVAVGLSAGFLEPLEASSLVLVEMSAQFIAEQLPKQQSIMNIVEQRFNNTFHYRWAQIIDFLKLHYVLSERTEPFWLRHRDADTITDSLTEQLALWRHHAPWHHDFDHAQEVFPSASYQYILYGMQPRYTKVRGSDPNRYASLLESSQEQVKRHVNIGRQQLYDQKTLLKNIEKHGFTLQ